MKLQIIATLNLYKAPMVTECDSLDHHKKEKYLRKLVRQTKVTMIIQPD